MGAYRYRSRVRRAWLVVAGCLAAVLTAASGQSAAIAAVPFQKTLPLNGWEHSDARLAAALDLAQDVGVTQIQTSAPWWWMTRAGIPRSYDWTGTDRLVAGAERRGMRVVMQLQGTPDWVHPDLTRSVSDRVERSWYPPTRNATELGHWSDYVTDVVTRYRGRVAQYEVWNEENWSNFWKPAPDVDGYARLLRSAYQAVEAADPAATVVFGGLDRNDVGYLRAYYESVERQWPRAGESNRFFFDVLGVHPYSDARSPRINDPAFVRGGVDRNFIGFRRLKHLMEDREGHGKRIYIGEYGFSTTHTWMPAVPDATRARHLDDAFALAAAEGYVSGMSWYYFLPDSANGIEWALVDPLLRTSLTFDALRDAPSTEPPSLIEPSAVITKPLAVRLRARDRVRLSRAISHGLTLRVGCTRACKFSARALAGSGRARTSNAIVLGQTRGSAGRSVTRRLRLTLRRRAVLRSLRGGVHKVRLIVKAGDRHGGSATAQRTVRVL